MISCFPNLVQADVRAHQFVTGIEQLLNKVTTQLDAELQEARNALNR